jgi:hypothetical protein
MLLGKRRSDMNMIKNLKYSIWQFEKQRLQQL